MEKFYCMLFIVTILLLLGNTKQFHAFRKINYFLVCIILILFSGFRYTPWGDYATYMIGFDHYKSSGLFSGEVIGSVIIAHLTSLISDDYALWFFVYSFFTIGLITYTIYKHSVNYEYSILLFILMGMWHVSFNIVKQYAAIAILFYAQDFIINKQFKRWVLACLVAACFHISALLMIPVYFLLISKVSLKKIILYIFIGIILYVSYQVLFDTMTFLKQGEAVTTMDSAVGERSVNVLRIMVNCVPALLYTYMKYMKVGKQIAENSEIDMLANFSFITAVISLVSMNSVYLARFYAYTDIFSTLLYPYILSRFSRGIKIVFGIVILICYFIFWSFDLTKGDFAADFDWIFNR